VRRIRLLTTSILGTFAKLAHANRDRLFRMWLISPWLRSEPHREDPLSLLLDSLRGTTCDVILFTRQPEFAWHREAVELVRANSRCTLYYCDRLHTKLYLLECDGFRAAVIGSPNFTRTADRRNLELAIELRTTVESDRDDVAALISELAGYASALRNDEGVTLA
jgi:hypothetical protein